MPAIRFRFSVFEFEPGCNELRRDGALVRLQAQPARVLACLLERAGEVVSREELHRAVWPTGTFVQFDRGLNFCIAQLRGVLKDDALAPRYIRTIPKSGYQFIAPVERVSSGAKRAEEIRVPDIRRRALRRVVLVSVGALTIFAAGYWSSRFGMAKRDPIIAIARFDNETGDRELGRFGDAVTDNLVADLTAAGRGQYRVIGNARLLRAPREQRDLSVIGASLGASYVVLGQIQVSGERTRVLAHLIHLPEQTHVSVARIDRRMDDPLTLESQLAETISSQFAPRIKAHSVKAVSVTTASH